jgi:hypothetical protein
MRSAMKYSIVIVGRRLPSTSIRPASVFDPTEAEAEQEVALFLREGRGGRAGHEGGEGEGCDLFHGLSTFILTPPAMGGFRSNHFDVNQIRGTVLHCGKIATGLRQEEGLSCV